MFVPSELRESNPFFYNECAGMKTDSKFDQIKAMYFSDLYKLAISRFKWEGLPEEIPAWVMEYMLFWFGNCMLVRDQVGDRLMYAIKKFTLSGSIDIYGLGNDRYGYTMNGVNIEDYSKLDSVIAYDNYALASTANMCLIYAERLTRAHMTSDLNLTAHQTPLLGVADTAEALTMNSVSTQFFEYVPILKLKNMTAEELKNRFQVLSLNAPIVFDKAEMLRESVYSDALTKLGIESFWKDKKERLTSNESEGTMGAVEMERKAYLMPRENFCGAVNKIFGLNVSVSFNSDLPTMVNNPFMFMEEGA